MTPVEVYNGIYVKRDDLCFPAPAPPFSKCRGLLKKLGNLKHLGITTVGYTETSISMAGWGVAWACKELGMKAVIFDPQYKQTPEVLAYHREQWKKFNATIIPIKAGMAKVNFYISKKILEENYSRSILLPLGLPFNETIEETYKETLVTLEKCNYIKSVVTCVGSGTMVAGIWKAMSYLKGNMNLYGIMTRTGNVEKKKALILRKAGFSEGIFGPSIDLHLIDEGWEYTDKSIVDCPFPCHAYYDLKAWAWLLLNRENLQEPILFWNIGH